MSDPTRIPRILSKLETIWCAHPEDTLADVLHQSMGEHSSYDSDFGSWYLYDDYVEETLDKRIAAEKLSLSGGWKS